MVITIDMADGHGFSALLVTVKEEKGNAVFAVHFAVKPFMLWSASVGVLSTLQSLQRQTSL